MRDSIWKKKITIYSFIFCIVGVIAVFVIFPKTSVSVSERRRLADKPELTVKSLLDESFMGDLEEYLLDHFPLRDNLRKIKTFYAYNILGQKENNDIYVADGHASKLEYMLNQNSVERLSKKMIDLKEKYFADADVRYSIIPDKNYFIAEKNGYPSMDYELMVKLLNDGLSSQNGQFQYIDIMSKLDVDDYYKTDTHWKQENIFDVAEAICQSFDMDNFFDLNSTDYNSNRINDFYGVYYGQAALPMDADNIIYMTNKVLDEAYVWNIEENMSNGNVTMLNDEKAVINSVYRLDKLNDDRSLDKYDIFLGGAQSLQIIKSPLANTDKRLIIFRDSYTSSLAPLLLSAYNEIILIDIRYIDSRMLGDYVDFKDADILFLYSIQIVNNSGLLK